MNDTESIHRTYQSYLLRLWRDDTRKPWRASLQSVATEETFRFANVEALFMFLEAQLVMEDDTSQDTQAR